MKIKQKISTAGFSLVELTVVVMLLGMMMTFGIKLASSFQAKASAATTRERQANIRDALISYLGQNGRLPCPADFVANTPSNGLESLAPLPAAEGTCNQNPGIVPYATLGMTRDSVLDGWDRFFLYEVTNQSHVGIPCTSNWSKISYLIPNNANTPKTYHDGEAGCITVYEDITGDGNTADDRNSTNIVAVLVSTGQNGLGGYSSKFTVLDNTDAASSNEDSNIPGLKANFSYRIQPPALEGFDDMVMALTANDLLNPLKKDGSVVSISYLARNELNNFNLNPSTCAITLPTNSAVTVPSATDLPTLTLTVSYTGGSVTRVIDSSLYGCDDGFDYSIPP